MSSLAKIQELLPRQFKNTMEYDPALSDWEQLQHWCIQATHSKNLFEFCEWMIDASRGTECETDELESIRDVGRKILSETDKVKEFCEKLFARHGLNATPINNHPGTGSGNQYVVLDYLIPADELAPFVDSLTSEDFIPWQPWGLLTPDEIVSSQDSLTLMNTADDTSRVTLHWKTDASRGGLVKSIKKLLGPRGKKVDNTGLGPFLGTPVSLLPQLFDLAGLSENDRLADLGCGDGRVLIEAVKITQCKVTGIENDMRLVEIGRKKILDAGMAQKIELIHGDGASAGFNDYDVIFLFLPISTLGQLIPALMGQMKPGSRIIAHEQRRMKHLPGPKKSRLLYAGHSLTVGHVWEV